MSEQVPIPLVGLILTDRMSGEILLLHRRDHMQWQLPGGRIEERDGLVPGVETSIEPASANAVMRHAREELAIVINEDRIQFLGSAPFTQLGRDYHCRYYELKTSIDLALLNDPHDYDDIKKLSPFMLNTLRRPKYSANLISFGGQLASGEILLTF